MARKNSKTEGTLTLLAILCAIGIFLIKVFIIILPLVLIIGGAYYYFNWQKKKLAYYDNDFSMFYQTELKSKLIAAAVLIPIIAGLGYYLFSQMKLAEDEKKYKIELEIENKRIERENITKMLQAKKDSSNMYFVIANENYDKYHYKTAIKYLDSSLLILPGNENAITMKGRSLYKLKRYKELIGFYENRFQNPNKGESYLMLSKSHRKLGNMEEARVNAYYSSKEENEEGIKLYDKLNPIRKVITGYKRKCCDGTSSYSKGKGTCSGHGGVCKWNQPIYAKKRKYKI